MPVRRDPPYDKEWVPATIFAMDGSTSARNRLQVTKVSGIAVLLVYPGNEQVVVASQAQTHRS